MSRGILLALVLAGASGATGQSLDRVSPATPQDFRYEIIRLPESFGARRVFVERANAAGDLVGRYTILDNQQEVWRGFVRHQGSFATVHVEGAINTMARGINDERTIVGQYSDAKGDHGFIFSASRGFTKVDAPGATGTRMFDVANNGTISGSYKTAGLFQPAVWVGGTFTPLPAIAARLGADMAEGFGINQHGDVVGHFTRASEADVAPGGHQKMYGFVYRDGVVTATLDYPGSGWMSCAYGTSARGEVVGHYVDPVDGGVTGFVWKNGTFTARLRVDGAAETYPQSILPDGTLVGSAIMADQRRVGFIAVPRSR